MKPVVVRTTGELDAPARVVWAVLTDWERQSDWMLEMSDVVVTSSHREGVGVAALATVRIGGISTRDVIRVDVWEPPTHLGLAHEGWVKGRGDIRLQARPGARTHLDWVEELYPPWGVLGALGLRLFKPLLSRTFRRDLHVLQNIIRFEATRRYPGNNHDPS